jgi:hypothetical protein
MHFDNGTQRCKSLWNSEKVEKHFVAGAEDFQVILQHSVATQNQKWSGEDFFATVVDSAGSESYVPCRGSTCREKPSRLHHLEDCGAQQPGPDSCFRSERGDVLSLAKILKMANIDLDNKSFSNTTKRMQGVSLMLDITYENDREYWTWPWGKTISYSYRAREMDFGEQSRFRVSKWHHLSTNRDERILHVAFGVLILVTPHGTLGVFRLIALILSLSAAGALFGLSDVFVTKVLVQVYKFCKCLKLYDVYLVYQYFTRDMTASAEKVKEIVKSDGQSKFDDVTEEVQKDFERQSRIAKQAYWQAHDFREKQEMAECALVFAALAIVLGFLISVMSVGGGQV